MDNKIVPNNWQEIQNEISQYPCEDPTKLEQKPLSQVKKIKEQAFIPKVPEEGSETTYLRAWLFHPESLLRLLWDISAMLFIFYQAVSVPFRICFNVPTKGGWAVLEFIITLCFMLDILVNFNTGFYSKGALVMNRKKIASNYLKFWFWLDFIASFPYTWFIDGIFEEESEDSDQNFYRAPQLLRLIRIFRFLRILKLIRLAKLKRILIKVEDYIASNTLATLFLFFRLLSVVFFIAHWTACWWYFIGEQDTAVHPVTWITASGIENKPVFNKYITALYWAFTTMTTVGYGDIVPFTVAEKIYAMVSMIVACGVFAYTIGSIGSLVSKQNALENEYREQVVAVNRYMKKKDLPHELQFRVRRYLEYIWENKKKNNLDEKQILSLLSEPLRDEIYTYIHGGVVKLCPVFEHYDHHFISQLTRALENETYAPGDTVLEEGEISSKMYFILSGRIDIFHNPTKSSFKELGPKEFFGEIAFFTEQSRCASAKCLDFVDLLSLSRENMNLLLDKFPESKESTELIAKKCAEGDYSCLLIKCYICKALGHVAIRCRRILLNLDHHETKANWLKSRKSPATKYISAENYPTSKPKFNSRQVLGLPKSSDKLFPQSSKLYPKIKGYLKSFKQSGLSASTSVNSGTETPITRTRIPHYTIIYKDSEGSEEDPQDQARPRTFRYSLLKNSPENQQLSFSEASKPKKTAKVVPFTEIQEKDFDSSFW